MAHGVMNRFQVSSHEIMRYHVTCRVPRNPAHGKYKSIWHILKIKEKHASLKDNLLCDSHTAAGVPRGSSHVPLQLLCL